LDDGGARGDSVPLLEGEGPDTKVSLTPARRDVHPVDMIGTAYRQ